jgi:hypothetical protein
VISVGAIGTDFLPFITTTLSANSLDFTTGHLAIVELDGPAFWTFSVDAVPVPFEFEASLGLIALGSMFGGYALAKKRKNKKLTA